MKKRGLNSSEEIGYTTTTTTIDGNSPRATDKDNSENNAQIRAECEEIFNAQRGENGQHSQADTGRNARNVCDEISIIRPEQMQRESSQSRVKSRGEQKNKVNKRDYEKQSERHQRENSQARNRKEEEERIDRESSRSLSNKKDRYKL